MRSRALLSITLLALLCSSCEPVLFVVIGDKPQIELKDGAAHINGTLGKRFHQKFERFIAKHPTVKHCVLEQVPGSINDEWNVQTCLLLHRNGMTTEVTAESEVASGGVDLFMSGVKRTVAPGARIGVHSWSDGKKDGMEYPRDSEEHRLFLDFYTEIKVDTAFYWYTLRAAPAAAIHWMTPQELETYQVQTP